MINRISPMMKPFVLPALILCLWSPSFMQASEIGKQVFPENEGWLTWTSIEDLCTHRGDRVKLLMESLDLQREDLAEVAKAWRAGDAPAACRALLAHYRDPNTQPWLRPGGEAKAGPGVLASADEAVKNRFRRGKYTDDVPLRNGSWNWNHCGPRKYREWGFALNRHPFLGHLSRAWRATGEDAYAGTFDRIVRDWVLHVPCPGEKHQYTYTWRVLEAGIRLRTWVPAFYAMQPAESFSPAGRLLMLSSLAEHGAYVRAHHWDHHNHTLMELDGLVRLALGFPEFKQAAAWREHALKRMLAEMDHQVYDDGAHDELSSGYHWVSLHSYENFADACRQAGQELPAEYRRKLVAMYDYWAWLCRPDGSLPMNNRSDRQQAASKLRRAAAAYRRPDWRYIATAGRKGERPAGLASRFMPWAGQLISRSDWRAGSQWSFFDVGPAGHGWVHADKLHVSIRADGQDWLVDAGRFWYERDRWSRYAGHSRAHNVVLIDGCGQELAQRRAEKPIAEDRYAIGESRDWARGSIAAFAGLEGAATHTRTLVYLRGRGWLAVDRVATDRPRKLTAHWHFHPDAKVTDTPKGIVARVGEKQFTVRPAGLNWRVQLVRGQEKPEVLGWYCQRTPDWQPNTVAVHTAGIEKTATFAWVLWPGDSPPTAELLTAEGKTVKVRLSFPDGEEETLDVEMGAIP